MATSDDGKAMTLVLVFPVSVFLFPFAVFANNPVTRFRVAVTGANVVTHISSALWVIMIKPASIVANSTENSGEGNSVERVTSGLRVVVAELGAVQANVQTTTLAKVKMCGFDVLVAPVTTSVFRARVVAVGGRSFTASVAGGRAWLWLHLRQRRSQARQRDLDEISCLVFEKQAIHRHHIPVHGHEELRSGFFVHRKPVGAFTVIFAQVFLSELDLTQRFETVVRAKRAWLG